MGGNPHLVRFIERFAKNAKKVGWRGLLVGDMSQPRGGPMLSSHTSHQVGLDVDIWFTPMPDHVQSREEREFSSATDVVAPDLLDVDPEVWTHTHTELIRTAAQDPAVVLASTVKVKFENEKVRVLEAELPAGVKEKMHSHPAYVIYVLAGGKVRNYAADGKITEAEVKTGDVLYREPLTHAAENIGTTTLHMILVEMKTAPAK